MALFNLKAVPPHVFSKLASRTDSAFRSLKVSAVVCNGKYDDTLNLPKTEFPMRADAAMREPRIRDNIFADLYAWQRTRTQQDGSAGTPPATFIMHDGPPFANGKPHTGHALNKILKDICCRYQMLQGKTVSFIPGWDCHGLPIEVLAAKSLSGKEKKLPPQERTLVLRSKARGIAEDAIQVQREAFRNWGVLADWEHPYRTMDPTYEASQLELFYNMFRKGVIVQGFKPVFWSPSSRTALAEAELEYKDHTSRAVYVKFDMHPGPELQTFLSSHGIDRLRALVWTTTPWTLPANQALALNRHVAYSMSRAGTTNEWMLVATDRLDAVGAALDTVWEESVAVPPTLFPALIGSTYQPLGLGTSCSSSGPSSLPILEAAYVTADSGTGIVHTAPAHGTEDFQTCHRYSINVGTALVNDAGKFEAGAGEELYGRSVLGDGNDKVIELLAHYTSLAAVHDYNHRYPHDWRTRKPVILRATKQWFIDLTHASKHAIDALNDVTTIPASGKARLASMLDGRMDWCISRQRSWGVPLPVFYHKDTGDVLLTDASIEHLLALVRERGVDCWWELSERELLPPDLQCHAHQYQKGYDTMDVWLDSGSSWRAVLHAREAGSTCADVYLEGSDQHRGWFQSSLLTSVVGQDPDPEHIGAAPYRTLVTHGFVVDQNGKKMSKSLNNGIDPEDVISGVQSAKGKQVQPAYGADVLRVWVASSEFTQDVSMGTDILQSTSEQFRKIRNSGRFLLGNLSDFDPAEHAVPVGQLAALDRHLLHVLGSTVATMDAAFQSFAYAKAYQAITTLVNSHLKSFYFEVAKDRLYLEAPGSIQRRSAQTAMHHAVLVLVTGLWPIAPHLAEELYSFATHGSDPCGEPGRDATFDSLLKHRGWLRAEEMHGWHDDALARDFDDIKKLRGILFRGIEHARQEGAVQTSADASLTVHVPVALFDAVQRQLAPSEAHGSHRYTAEEVFLCSRVSFQASDGTPSAAGGEGSATTYSEDWTAGHKVEVIISATDAHKCPRCWRYTSTTNDTPCYRCASIVGRS
eukprot:m.774454 g.774454  ORF g.774454 m.774454 type:complete len:1036 (+) comp23256_c0_seq1:181-3288(+)